MVFVLKNKFISLALFIIIVVVLFRVVDKYNVIHKEKELTQVLVENCRVQDKPCIVNIGDLNLRISFAKNIYYLKPFNIAISAVDDSNINSMQVDFKMKNMDMGVNQFQLKRDIKKPGYWHGKALLPICVTGRADWYSELDVTTKKGRYQIILPILVKQASR